MGCTQCGANDGRSMRITYTDGTTETLTLCSDCRRQFGEGDLIVGVDPEEE